MKREHFLYVVAGIVAAPFALVPVLWLTLVLLSAVGIAHAYRIPSSAMEPTLHCARDGAGCEGTSSDRLIAFDYLFGDPKRGDLVAFRAPAAAAVMCGTAGTYLKRIVGLPGETFEERAGVVYIDDRPLAERWLRDDRRDTESWPPRRIPPGRYVVLGDNRKFSCDSRRFGAVARHSIIGHADFRYWPPMRIGFL